MCCKDHQDGFPILACIARGILSTPANSSGVEGLCDPARDIRHYRRLHAEAKNNHGPYDVSVYDTV